MSLLDHLKQEVLLDLLKAYDSYIATAVDAGLFKTGWTPVCVEEFYGNEYMNVWDPKKGDESFDYMFSPEDRADAPGEFYDLNGTRIFREATALKCRFDDEDHDRFLRNRIQDIRDGDCFIVCGMVRTADGNAHQNIDEPDCPWIVYDVSGEGWFEGDVVHAERFLAASSYGKAEYHQGADKIPVTLVDLIRSCDTEGMSWSDSFWVDAKIVPTEDLFRKVIQDYLMTEAGHRDIERTNHDFNWGDAALYIPSEHWNRYGIYPLDPLHPVWESNLEPTSPYSMYSISVDQDEILIPESYWKEHPHGSGRSLADMIQGAHHPETPCSPNKHNRKTDREVPL